MELWKELVFDTQDLNDKQLVAYQEGILSCLEKLGIEVLYDETDPDASTYKVVTYKVVPEKK